MATLEENRRTWSAHDWSRQGEEWSEVWGGAENQWWGTWFPRLRRFLPADTILEIAPGFGRWTQFVLPACRRLIGVDLTEACTQGCRTRFAAYPRAVFHTNDGSSLPMVADGSVEFAFSLDSLVHADHGVLDGYLRELGRVLRPEGVALLHHSNVADLPAGSLAGLPVTRTHWRAPDVGAKAIEQLARKHGLSCFAQECVNWGGDLLLDCLSALCRRGSENDRPLTRVENPLFMEEALRVRATAELFARDTTARPSVSWSEKFGPLPVLEPESRSVHVPLPPAELMALVCGRDFSRFALEGRSETGRLEDLGMLSQGTRFLDIGCGCGRMARYLLDAPIASYDGFDRHPGMIEWCVRNISSVRPEFRFRFEPLKSEYERIDGVAGDLDPAAFRFPYADGSFDSALAASVFTHMPFEQVETYLHELARVLALRGRALVSVFLAEHRDHSEGLGFYHGETRWLSLLKQSKLRHVQINARRFEPIAPEFVAHHNWFLLEK